METRVAILWKDNRRTGRITGSDCLLSGSRISGGDSHAEEGQLIISLGEQARLEFAASRVTAGPSSNPAIISVHEVQSPFSFFLRDVNRSQPIYIPDYEVIVTEASDSRSYDEIVNEIRQRGLQTKLQQYAAELEESYEQASAVTRNLPGQTWLGLSRDIRIFGVGFRGVGGEERLWDWVQPRFHGHEVSLPENDGKPVRYHFMMGRGIGAVESVSRRLEEGILPILHTKVTDDDMVYHVTTLVSYEKTKLTSDSLRGTHYLVADGYGHGHMLTESQAQHRESLLPEAMNQEEETVLYCKIQASNTGSVPRYAWFKSVVPNAGVITNGVSYSFDGQSGFGSYSPDRVFCVSKLNGKPLPQEETAMLLQPGETATIEFYLPHRPVSEERAEQLILRDFAIVREECRRFWKDKLAGAANVNVPESRIGEMIKAGLLHLDLVAYGLEPEGTVVPTIGVYTAIGSESSPIVQFMDSMGWHDLARRSLMFFLDKQHDDGFIQNFGGYMLETGAALWSIGEHYRYTKDEAWKKEVTPKLLKAYEYLLNWRQRNQTEQFVGRGYGMLDGKTADPEDPYHSFMLNGYAYLGLSRLSEMLSEDDPALSRKIAEDAKDLKQDIREGFFACMAKSPVVPLGDGTWCPTVAPWVEHKGPLSLYAEGGKWYTHGAFVARDSLLGPLYLVLQEVIEPNEPAAEYMLNFHSELMCVRNVALSQPFYSIHPFVHLMRGEVKPFLKAYYNGFSGLADRETYTFWEHYFHASPHKTHEEGWFLMQTRWMLYMEEGDTLKLFPGIPRAWLENGKSINLENAATYFGPVSVSAQSMLEQGYMEVEVKCDPARAPKQVAVRLPHPEEISAIRVTEGIYDKQKETVTIGLSEGHARFKLMFH